MKDEFRANYNLYGLCIRSDWPLHCRESGEELTPTIELIKTDAPLLDPCNLPDSTDTTSQCVTMNDGASYLRWPGRMEFLIGPDGRKILAHALHSDAGETLQALFFGGVLSFALLKLGIEQLHATAIVVQDRVIAFLGETGYGKSTLAAAFVQHGYPLLTDDLLVIYEKDNSFFARPGLPRLKLFADSAKAVRSDVFGLGSTVNRVNGKQVTQLSTDRFYEMDARLHALYTLNPGGAAIKIEKLPQREAFVEICKAAFNGEVAEAGRLREHFSMASRMASSVPVKRLSIARNLESLPSICAAVLKDLQDTANHA